jgi:hypothetical protein
MTEGAAEHSANQRRGVVSRLDDRGGPAEQLKVDLNWAEQLSVLSWVECKVFVVCWKETLLWNNRFNMLYLFATDFHDLSHGDGRGIADLNARARMCIESWTVRQCGTSRSALSQNMPEC